MEPGNEVIRLINVYPNKRANRYTNSAILAQPLEPTEAISRIKRICQMPHVCLLSTPVELFEGWMKLLSERPVSNGGIFDLLHIAIMLAHQVTSIYTFNAKDFYWCSQIEVIDPGNF